MKPPCRICQKTRLTGKKLGLPLKPTGCFTPCPEAMRNSKRRAGKEKGRRCGRGKRAGESDVRRQTMGAGYCAAQPVRSDAKYACVGGRNGVVGLIWPSERGFRENGRRRGTFLMPEFRFYPPSAMKEPSQATPATVRGIGLVNLEKCVRSSFCFDPVGERVGAVVADVVFHGKSLVVGH